MGQNSVSEIEDGGAFSVNSPLSCNECDSVGGKSSGGNGIILKKGPWTSAEDAVLMDYVKRHGEGNWNAVQKHTGLARCGKSCRLRWANHLRPNLKKGAFTLEEERIIIELHAKMGNKWARMASHLPGRTDNEIKNYWNTRIKRRQRAGLPLYPPNLPAQSKSHQPLSSPSNCIGDFATHDDILQFNGEGKSDAMSGLLVSFNIIQNMVYLLPVTQATMFFYLIIVTVLLKGQMNSCYNMKALILVNHIWLVPLELINSCQVSSLSQSFSLKFPGDLGHSRKAIGFYQDTQLVFSIVPSASKHLIDAQKLELPSLQYQETSLGFWDPKSKPSDAVTQSSVSGALSWNYPFIGSSGMLEDLIYGAKALNKSECHSDCWSTLCDINPVDINGHSASKGCLTGKASFDPISTLDNPVGSDSILQTTTRTMGSSLEDIIVHHLKSEIVDENWMPIDETKNSMHNLDYYRPDTLLESCGDLRSSLFASENFSTDSTAALLGDSSTSGLGSCSWSNMPPVCKISETP